MMRGALITAVMFALMLCGCSSEPPAEMTNQIADMEKEIAGMEEELAEVNALVGDLKSELTACNDELRAFMQEKLQEAEALVEGVTEGAPEVPEAPEIPELPKPGEAIKEVVPLAEAPEEPPITFWETVPGGIWGAAAFFLILLGILIYVKFLWKG